MYTMNSVSILNSIKLKNVINSTVHFVFVTFFCIFVTQSIAASALLDNILTRACGGKKKCVRVCLDFFCLFFLFLFKHYFVLGPSHTGLETGWKPLIAMKLERKKKWNPQSQSCRPVSKTGITLWEVTCCCQVKLIAKRYMVRHRKPP